MLMAGRGWRLLPLVLLLALGLATAACGQSPPRPAAKGGSAAPPSEPVRGGRLVYALAQEPDHLLSPLTAMGSAGDILATVMNGLVRMDDRMRWIPDLADAVPTVENGGVRIDGRKMTVTYRLRRGVLWHDGQPFTSRDVRFTFQTIMNPRVNVLSRAGYDQIEALETPDDHTVVIRFKSLYPDYLSLFSAGVGSFILPAHLLEKSSDLNRDPFDRHPVGTGPFRFKEWVKGSHITVERNPTYYGGEPYLEAVIFKFVPDSGQLVTQLKTGEAHVISGSDWVHLDELERLPGVKTHVTPGMMWEHLSFNLDRPVFQDVRVRRAIRAAIDRQAITRSLFKGRVEVATGDQPPLSWAHNPNLKPAGRDVAAARRLLEEAGWRPGPDGIYEMNGRRLSFSCSTVAGNRTREQLQQVIQQQLREAGIEMTIKNYEAAAFFDVLMKRNFDAGIWTWTSGTDPDTYPLWHSSQIPAAGNPNGLNVVGWRNPEVDRLTEAARSTLDKETRRKAYWRVQELENEEVPLIFLYYQADISATSDRVRNFKPNPTYYGNTWNAREWWLSP